MKKLMQFIVTFIALGVVWWLVSPLFIDESVDEAFPFAEMTEGEYEDLQEAMEDVGLEVPSMEEVKEMNDDDADALREEVDEAAAQMEDEPVDEPMTSSPEVVVSGVFQDADAAHKGEGTVSLYDLGDGSQLLRFESFRVTNGPDLRVLLTKGGDVATAVELGKLKGNVGDQNYEIPAGLDASGYDTVLIYCKPFRVTFATATMQ